jgi:hypothetical protein
MGGRWQRRRASLLLQSGGGAMVRFAADLHADSNIDSANRIPSLHLYSQGWRKCQITSLGGEFFVSWLGVCCGIRRDEGSRRGLSSAVYVSALTNPTPPRRAPNRRDQLADAGPEKDAALWQSFLEKARAREGKDGHSRHAAGGESKG